MPPMMTPPPMPPAMMQPAQGTPGYLGVVPPGVVKHSAVAHVGVPGVVPNAPQPMLFAPVTYATGPQPVAPSLPQAQGTDWKATAYSLAENGAWLAGKATPLAAAGAAVFSVAGANHKAAKDMKELVEQYRDTIAPVVGVAPEQVDEKMLRELVERNPEQFALIKQEIERIEKAQTNNPITSVASGAAGVAAYAAGSGVAGAALAAPVAAVVGAAAAPVVVGLGAALAAPWFVQKASNMILGDADGEQTAHKAVMEMQQQWVEGEQPVVPLQVFEVFVRLDQDFAKSIEERAGKTWSDMTPEEKQAFALREEQHLAQMSMAIAGSINARQMSPLQLSAVNPRQLAGQQPVMIAGPQRVVAQTPVGTQQRDSRVMGPFTQKVVAQQAANTNQPGMTPRSA